jgi:hypothetical protein
MMSASAVGSVEFIYVSVGSLAGVGRSRGAGQG